MAEKTPENIEKPVDSGPNSLPTGTVSAPAEREQDAAGEDSASSASPDKHETGLSNSNVTILRRPRSNGSEEERTFHIIGTAHVSRRSVEEVERVIEELVPDTVCVELCRTRFEALTDDDRWRRLNIFQVIRQRKMLFLMASLALQIYQKRLGEKLGVKPGAELLAGITTGEKVGARVVLVDRDIQATLRRTWANLGLLDKFKLIGALMASMFESEENELEEADIEALKDRDHISEMMNEFARVMPGVKVPLIDERDQYLMSAIEDAPGKTVVAVVGAGHVAGMVDNLGRAIDREALSALPTPSKFWRMAKWIIPAIILVAFYYGYSQNEGRAFSQMLTAWILPNAIMAALLTLIAGGKLISVFTALVASPITSLNPTLGAGMIVGLVEAWLRKPTVEDCERLGKEASSWKALHGNPFSRTLIVAIAANLGSALGAYLGTAWVLKVIS